MDIKDLANVSTVVINSLLMLLKDNHVDLESVVMQLSNNDEALSPDVNLMELTQQTLGELKKANASVPEGFVLVEKKNTEDWYLDEFEGMWFDHDGIDGGLCELDIGEV